MKRWAIYLSVLIISFFFNSAKSEIPELLGTVRADAFNTLFGTRIIPLGDQNDDGFDDFLTWGFNFKAYLYHGNSNLDIISYTLRFDSVQNRFNEIGDVNSDSYDDILIGGRSPVNWQLNLYYGGPAIDTVRDLWFGNDTTQGDGFSTLTNDLDNDGNPEICTWFIEHNSIALYNLGTDSDSIPDLEIYPANLNGRYDAFGESLISGDFNGDGIDDLAANVRHFSTDSLKGQIYFYWGGPQFDTVPDLIITRPGEKILGSSFFGRVLENIGDINNDGYEDIFVNSSISYSDTVSFIYFGGPEIDTIPDLIFSEKILKARKAGDLNGDDIIDLITSYPLSLTSIGHVNIYYGSSNFDSIPDITIHNSDMPQWQSYFGMDCSGVGDANGDGINDFAFSAVESDGHGVVYIFSGIGSGTDVKYVYEPNLPDNIQLYQNHPNPFNPTTTISFEIPIKSTVSLTIYNVLGQKIRTLINKELSAGSYTLQWDGKDQIGNSVASGIYIYKLESDQISLSKKMMLIK